MKKFTLHLVALLLFNAGLSAQKATNAFDRTKNLHRCSTMEELAKQIQKDPTLPLKWKAEGEKQYKAYLQRVSSGAQARLENSAAAGPVIIPVVFHIVDIASAQSWITDRDLYEQVEILNEDYGGKKMDKYIKVIPPEIAARVGRVGVKFVLARRTPAGALTTGIERRVGTSPDHISIKANATGGLDAWDVNKYVNVWCGTFSGADDGLLGISTFPFTTGQGPHGVVIGTATLPFTSNTARSYYPAYSEGSTLSHEIGHYFYLIHTFGDASTCNNNDFQLVSGWPLPTGAGPEGDDTPEEKAGPGNAYFGNPSQNYSDGCTALPFGEMYGSFMNYFDDRALFMFSDGSRKRVEGCLSLYRSGLLATNGATPPVAVTDAFLVNVTPHGTPERREFMVNNNPLTATVRNNGTASLSSVTLNVKLDAGATVSTIFPLNLVAGNDTTLNLGLVTGAAGSHTVTIYTTAPNSAADNFLNNDTIQSFINITNASITAPFTESFTSTTFPPAGWQIWNPNGGSTSTWTKAASSGFTAAGSAGFIDYNINQTGTLDDLISPPIDLGTSDTASLSFEVAYAVYDDVDVSVWDGLEVYVSGNGGVTYNLAYKKTGNQLKTIIPAQTGSFTATPAQATRWRLENVNLTPYLVSGKKMMLKFRNTNAFGNNLYIDDIKVAGGNFSKRDAFPIRILNVPDLICTGAISPSLIFGSNGKDTLKSLSINTQVDNGAASVITWTGSITQGQTAQIVLGNIPIAGLSPGPHVLTVFTSNPNGLDDQNTSNDTIHINFTIIPQIPIPVTEGFESPTFPPTNWYVQNSDASLTWERTTEAAKTGVASMTIRNFDYTSANTTDKFISSILTGGAAFDSLFVAFDLAYKPGVQYPGSIDLPLDTLELQVSKDCGATITTVWKKWGEDLQTINDPNNSSRDRFVPTSDADWKHINVYITPFTGSQNFQVYFVAKSNKQNNLYIDNINISGKILPQRLKNQGYLISPSPFVNTFLIHFLQPPTTVKTIGIFNSVGQRVWNKDINGNGNTEMTVSLAGMPAGVYIVKIEYVDKTVVERIVKQ